MTARRFGRRSTSAPVGGAAPTCHSPSAASEARSRALRNECHDVIDSLSVPDPFDLDRFVRVVAQRRGKRIELVPARLGATAPCGMLAGTPEVDYICFASNTSALHARHIVMHELGHLVFGHHGDMNAVTGAQEPAAAGGRTELEMEVLRHLMPNLDPALITELLGRTVYDTEQERQAEMFASIILSAVPLQLGQPRHPEPVGDRPALFGWMSDAPLSATLDHGLLRRLRHRMAPEITTRVAG